MGRPPSRRKALAASGASAAGAALVVGGTFLVWFKAPGTEEDVVRGIEMFVGRLVVTGAGLIAASSVILLVIRSRTVRRAVAVGACVVAVALSLVALYAAYAPLEAFVRFVAVEAGASSPGVAADEVARALHDSGIVISSGLGAWLSAVGALLAVGGSVAAVALSGGGRVVPGRRSRTARS